MLEILNPFKKQKLTITAVRAGSVESKTFEAMFNPPNYTITQRVKWKTPNANTPNNGSGAGAGAQSALPQLGTANPSAPSSNEPQFDCLEYGNFAVKLILDGTGVSESGFTTGFGFKIKKVKDRVKKFLDVCYKIDENIHQPNKVSIKWGDGINFNAFLESVNINYTLFDASGNALRAELDTVFKIAPDAVKLASPDLTHTREVHDGDTLPLLSKEIYGSSRYYLFIAEANKLDDFRNLKPGTKLYFPPLENQL